MSDPIDNLRACMGCGNRRAPDGAGRSECGLTSLTIQEHAMSSDCPAGRYGTAGKCGRCGGPHGIATCQIPPNYDGNYRNDSKGTGGCNCS